MNKCLSCLNGAIVIGQRGSIYIAKKAINKDKDINYDKNEQGCRNLNDKFQSKVCLENNYCFYEHFDLQKIKNDL